MEKCKDCIYSKINKGICCDEDKETGCEGKDFNGFKSQK